MALRDSYFLSQLISSNLSLKAGKLNCLKRKKDFKFNWLILKSNCSKNWQVQRVTFWKINNWLRIWIRLKSRASKLNKHWQSQRTLVYHSMNKEMSIETLLLLDQISSWLSVISSRSTTCISSVWQPSLKCSQDLLKQDLMLAAPKRSFRSSKIP